MSKAGRLETVRRGAALLALSFLHLACGDSGGTSSGSGGGSTPSSVLSAWGSSPTSISLSWTDPSLEYTGTPEAKYSTVFRDGARVADIEGFSYLDEGLQPGTTYSYSVVVTAIYWFISYVTYSWGSNRAIATTLTDSVPPQIPVHVRAIGLSPSEIQVTWDAASDNDQVSVYAIYRDGAFVGTSPVTTFVDAGLSVTTTYSYAVAARDRSGNQSALSAPALGMTLARTILVDPGAANNAMALDSAATPHFIHIPASSRTPLR